MRDLSKLVDVILVVGAQNSSNSNRLREIGAEEGIPSYLIADGSALQPEWVKDAEVVGLTAGASAPEVLVEDVIDALRRHRPGRGLDAARPRGAHGIPPARRTDGGLRHPDRQPGELTFRSRPSEITS